VCRSRFGQAQIIEKLKAAKAKKEIPPPEPGGMAYMMSKQAYLTDRVPHNLAHVMFFVPTTDPATWAANSAIAPIALLQQDPIADITTFGVLVGTWSDGTAVPSSHGTAAPSSDSARCSFSLQVRSGWRRGASSFLLPDSRRWECHCGCVGKSNQVRGLQRIGTGKKGQKHELIGVHEYDIKAAMHLICLLNEGIELMRSGTITLPRPEQ
jgi:hypothetical protein